MPLKCPKNLETCTLLASFSGLTAVSAPVFAPGYILWPFVWCGGRVVESGALLKRCTPKRVPRVRIPPSPILYLSAFLLYISGLRESAGEGYNRISHVIVANDKARKRTILELFLTTFYDFFPASRFLIYAPCRCTVLRSRFLIHL
jgi:hypothetical protein